MNQEWQNEPLKERSRRFDRENIKIPSPSARNSLNESPTTKTNTKSSRNSKISEFLVVNEDPLENEKEENRKISKGLFFINDRFELTPANSKKKSFFFSLRKKLANVYKRSKSLEKDHLDRVEEQKNEEEPVQLKRLEAKRIGRRKISLPTDGNEFNRKLTERRKEMHNYEEDSPIKEDISEFEELRKRPCSVNQLNRSSQRSLRVDEIDKSKKYFYMSSEKSIERVDNMIVENPEAEIEEKNKITRLEGSKEFETKNSLWEARRRKYLHEEHYKERSR